MIGLGGNRLTVCRRGGMSVTQAGRGGMEWLGVRDPIWASPYSAAATAALKAQFPTQWPTIRDYGFSHPALVPFINEDPMLVCSLIPELGKIRWLVSAGAAYVDTGYKPSYKTNTECLFNKTEYSGSPFGVRWGGSNVSYPTFGIQGERNTYGEWWRGRYTGSEYANLNLSLNTEYHLIQVGTSAKFYLTSGTVAKDITTTSNTYTNSFVSTYNLYVMAKNDNGTNETGAVKVAYLKITEDGQLIHHYVPFVGATRQGMVDAITGEYLPKQGTGSFTISETPAS